MCQIQGPAVQPENLQSVIKATFVNPAHLIADVGVNISGIQGAQAGHW
jgi:hypothetical protein